MSLWHVWTINHGRSYWAVEADTPLEAVSKVYPAVSDGQRVAVVEDKDVMKLEGTTRWRVVEDGKESL